MGGAHPKVMNTVNPTAQTYQTRPAAQRSIVAGGLEHWPRNMQTCDGAPYRIRPLREDDLQRDRRFLTGLSPDSRYNRMMRAMGAPSRELLERLVHVDPRDSMALAAVVGEEADESIIGVARYGGDPDRCEFAIAVADAWQSRGVGTAQSQLLFEYAKAHGVRRMYATTFTRNNRMLNLARDLHMDAHCAPHDLGVVEAWRSL